ncbi:MAG TPA: S9 family peptidase [Chthoniobacterales bacterium]|nr:S9 family peptidase [Chthoniobacterales bacterium]
MIRFISALLIAALGATSAFAAETPAKILTPGDNLVIDGVPPIPIELVDQISRYTESRTALVQDWHPAKSEILIITRFGDVPQVHRVAMAGGARTQLTFLPDRIAGVSYQPANGEYLIFSKSIGGSEFDQNYRYDVATGDISLLTDGKSKNSGPTWSTKGDRVAYTSTRRNGADTDIYVAAPNDIKTDRLVAEVKGGGWEIQDWSPDDSQLLVLEQISINETYLWLINVDTGEKKELLPRPPANAEKVAYRKARFAKDGKGIFASTDRESEYQRLAYIDPASGKHSYLLPNAKWDTDDWELSDDGKHIAYTLNENGTATLHLIDVTMKNGSPVASTPREPQFNPPLRNVVIAGLVWHRQPQGNLLAFNVSAARLPADVYVWDTEANTTTRWTESETGGIPAARFSEPELVRWKSFDGKEITGFLYLPDKTRFPGPRPVIINIHGGPEAQYRPVYLARNNYFINELGCAMLFPNVRGSAGYGKSFLKLDNGPKREDSYKDISALLDWLKTRPELDTSRVMVTGGSYGGFMTLAVASNYADRIRCALDVVGISNFVTFLKNTESYRRDLRRVEYGDERDPKMAEFLEKIAPLNNATKITKPLFVVQGANDPRVPKTEADQIVATLKKQNTPVWYLLAKDEGHGFAKKKNADYQFYATVQFIRQHLLN